MDIVHAYAEVNLKLPKCERMEIDTAALEAALASINY